VLLAASQKLMTSNGINVPLVDRFDIAALHVRGIIGRNQTTACKKRAAELRDEILFKQPENTHLGDCPICFLPLSLDLEKINYDGMLLQNDL
jgi:hypothetical protein